jgi:N-ethylmaleimide reductase
VNPDLFSPYTAGELRLRNRVVMAPMTRNRATEDGRATESMAEYYRQRAGAGLIITEGTEPSRTGKGYPRTPGIYTEAHVRAWQKVTSAVHEAGGAIVCQVMHAGRMSHPLTQPGHSTPVAPSAVRPAGLIDTPEGERPLVTPRALDPDEIPLVIAEFANAAQRAVAAGFDGIELHAANGYLLHQFLAGNTNLRTDAYGGSPAHRARFVVEVARACAERIGAGRVGIRISPAGRFNDIAEGDTRDIYTALLAGLGPLGLAYLHTVRRRSVNLDDVVASLWPGAVIVNTGYGHGSELDDLLPLVSEGTADLVSVGRLFISNPDLVYRWRTSASRAEWDEATFYTPGDAGYTDYPPAAEAAIEKEGSTL